jgi:transposase
VAKKKRTRKRYDGAFKAKAALAAARGDKTISELASEFGVHANLISQWKRRLLDNVAQVFEEGPDESTREHEAVVEELHRQLGKLHVELDWLKKKAAQLGR